MIPVMLRVCSNYFSKKSLIGKLKVNQKRVRSLFVAWAAEKLVISYVSLEELDGIFEQIR